MAERSAVIGVGQTKHDSVRDVSIAGLVREAAVRALEAAQMTWAAIAAVVLTILAAAWPAWRVTRLQPVDAMRHH